LKRCRFELWKFLEDSSFQLRKWIVVLWVRWLVFVLDDGELKTHPRWALFGKALDAGKGGMREDYF
jgi:hypothetical protein